MSQLIFPPLVLSEWKETRDTLQKYCRMVGAIRETMSKPLPHSMHTNLVINSKGFTTCLLPKNVFSSDQTFEVIIDLINTRLIIESSYREPLRIALTGQSLNALCDETCSELVDVGVKPPLEKPSFLEGTRGRFDPEPLAKYWGTVSAVHQVLNRIKTDFREETSPIQLRPDDLALILIWFGQEINGKGSPFEQQHEFGFSTGDELIQEAYFYIATFPDTQEIKNITDQKYLLQNNGKPYRAVLSYKEVIKSEDAEKMLTEFFKAAQVAFKKSTL
jgi:hypothetical protein